MATIKKFEDIESWKLARELFNKTGELIDNGNFQKSYRLINQIDGSSGSVMDNITEGFERGTRKEFIQFLGYSKGSCGEYRSQLYRALDRGYLTTVQFDELALLATRTSSLIQKFIEYLNKTEIAGTRKNVKP